jgi:hypothetical protein
MTTPVYHPKTQTGFRPAAKIDKLIPAGDALHVCRSGPHHFVEV